MLQALIESAINLVWIAGMSLVATGLGIILLRGTHTKATSVLESLVFSAGIGFGVLGYGVFFLGTFQLLQYTALYVLLGLMGALSLVGWFALRCPVEAQKNGSYRPGLSRWDKSLTGILLLFLLAGLMLVLTPSVGKDALIYHLAVPKLFLSHQGFYFVEGNVFGHYPLGGEMLYVLALAVHGEVLAKGIHFVMAVAVLLGMWQFGRRHIPDLSLLPLALLVFFTIPTVFMISHVAYNDLTLTLYTFLAVYAFVNWFQKEEKPWLLWCGVFSGLALSTKYTALFLPFLGCLGVLWTGRQRKMQTRQVVASVLLYLAFTFVVGCPFYLKNWFTTGNPFYPFLHGLFDGRGWDPEQARLYDLFVRSLGMGRGLVDYLLLPWNLSVNAKLHSPQFDGLLGPIFILVLPFAVGMRKVAVGAKIGLIYALFAFMFWASAAQQMRYLIPSFPFLAIMTAHVISDYRRKPLIFGILIVLAAGSLGVNGYHVVKHFLKVRPAGVVLGYEDKDAFLSRMLPSYDMFRYVNDNLPGDSKIFLIYMKNFGYLCDRPYYSDSMFESYTIQKILSQSETADDVYDLLREKGFTHILYDVDYVFGQLSTFSALQKERFSAFQEIHLELIREEKGRYYLAKLL